MDPKVCSVCGAPAEWTDDGEYMLLFPVVNADDSFFVCPGCADSEKLEMVLDPPDWLYVAYPENAAADMWGTRTDRYVTRSWRDFRRHMAVHATDEYRLCVGVQRDVSLYQMTFNDAIVEAIRHGGPPEDVMNDAFLAHAYRTHSTCTVRVYRVRDQQQRDFDVGSFASERAFVDAVNDHAGGGEWFMCESRPCGRLTVPAERWLPLYLNPRAHIDWIERGGVSHMRASVRRDPAWRTPAEIQYKKRI